MPRTPPPPPPPPGALLALAQETNYAGSFPHACAYPCTAIVLQVFHGMVYSDLLTNPLIVPVKVLRGGHSVVDHAGVLDVAFHTTQPWLFSAGADSNICLYCN